MIAKKSGSRSIAKVPHNRRTTHLHKLMKVAALPLLFLLFAAVVRGQSALDGFDPNANDNVYAAVVQADGKVLVGGNFTTLSPNGGPPVTRNHIARLNPDGTLDTAFDPNANGLFATIVSIVVQADGKILVGGQFNSIGGQMRNNIARLDATTGLADSFNPNANDFVKTIVVQPDGKILVGGRFDGTNSIGGQTRNRIARLDAVTGLADSFNPNSGGEIYAIAVLPNGKILVGGFFAIIGGQNRFDIARLDAVTGLADEFAPQADREVIAITLQTDGKILVGGHFTNIGGQTRNYIARLDPTTGLADSFNPNANGEVDSIVVQADGKILVGGFFHGTNSIGGQNRNYIARLDATTGLADSFDPSAGGGLPGNDGVVSIALQADGKILAGGFFTALAPNGGAGITRNRIARIETDGRLDQTLNLGALDSAVFATAVQPDGKILIGGGFFSVSGVTRRHIARLNSDGTLDLTFDPNANSNVSVIVVQADGKILVGGTFSGANSIGGQARNYIARLDPVTGLADSFNPNAGAFVESITVLSDGRILIGGGFFSVGGQPRGHIARLDPSTGLPDSFNPNSDDTVTSLVVQNDGKILACGGFTNVGGQPRNRIARLDPITGLADLFDPNPNATAFINLIALQADGKILVGGFFDSIGGQPRSHIARLDAATGLADAFAPNADNQVHSIAVQVDGKILVGGSFDSIGGQTRHKIARLDPATGLADSFDPSASSFGFVDSITLQADGKILAGGAFTSIGGQPRNHFARLSNDRAVLQNLAVTQSTVIWTRDGSGPQLARVTFELSTNNLSFTPLGNGTMTGNNWSLTGLNLPAGQNVYIRARGYYPSGYNNSSESITELVRNAFLPGPPPPTTLGNISTRLRVETGDNVLIGGFIVTGTQPKRVIVRAIGPSLPLAGALVDPVLELRDSSGGLILSNNDWRDDPAQESEINATGIPPSNNLESAIVATLPANGSAYTAIMRGLNNGTGIGVVEVYDLDQAANSKLANISTRGLVQTGDDVLIGGLIVLGQNPLRVIVRAIGPSLPLAGALGNPTLNLHDGNGTLLISNDNWRDDPAQESEIIATGIPPSNDLESAIVRNLTPGGYTAIVRGVNNTTGIAVVEVYGLN